jgi:hypothetical protein
MTALEVARLILADLGIGLLPFVWPAFLIATFLRFSHGGRGRLERYWIASIVLWIFLVVTNVVRLVQMSQEGVNTRKGTMYPMSDQVTDVAVEVGLYAVLVFVEVWR